MVYAYYLKIKNICLSGYAMWRYFICAYGLVLATAASADARELYNLELEELMNIKVKAASLFEESRMQAAASIDKINSKEWESWGARTNANALESIASLQAYPTFFGGSALAIRGYAQSLSARGIATLIDGVPVNEFIFGSAQYERERISLGVVDSIEIIKGPGSTLYGTDAFHGSVQFNSFYNDAEQIQFATQLGSFDYRQASVKFSEKLNDDLIVNLAADHRQQGSWMWQYNNLISLQTDNRDNHYETNSINLKLHNRASDDWHYMVQLHHNQFSGAGFVGGGGTNGYQQHDLSSSNNQFDMADAKLEHTLNDNVKIGARAVHWQVERHDMFEVRSGPKKYDHDIDKNQLQIYTSIERDSGSRLLLGLETSQQHIEQADFSQFNRDGSLISRTAQLESGATRRINSFYSQGRWITPFSWLQVEAGFRSDNYSEFGRQNSPRLALIFPYDDDHVFKLIYGNAFRAPVSAETYGSASIRGSLDIKPEEINSYEAVWMVAQEKSAYQITLFRNDWKNGIVSAPIVDPVYSSAFSNIGSNNSRGIEAAYKVELEKVLLQVDLAHVNSENEMSGLNYEAFPHWSGHVQVSREINAQHNFNVRWGYSFKWKANSLATAKKLPAKSSLDIAYQYKINHHAHFLVTLKDALNRLNYSPSLWGNPDGERLPERQLETQLQINF